MKMVEFQLVLVWHRKRSEVDVERIAVDVYPRIAETIDRKWLRHRCNDDVGCREG